MQPPLKGMNYPDFFQRYMGACRRKHLPAEVTLKELVKDVLKPSRRERSGLHNQGGRYRVPDKSTLPRNFIRLEPWEIEYLFALASRAEKRIVETGRYNGGSCFVMSCANAEVPIHSIDIAPQDDDRLRTLLSEHGVGQNIDLVVGDSQKGEYPDIQDIDLLFIDGDHSYDGCLADLEQWFPRVVPGGHVVLHDCYFGTQVQSAVLNFVERHEVEIVQTPFKSASHWRFPTGSLAHFRKR
jgi:predicted O-methyltransferase YrrM